MRAPSDFTTTKRDEWDDMSPLGKGCLTIFVGIPLAAFVGLISAFWQGFALTKLWDWFLVYEFGWEPLSVVTAAGIMCIASLLCIQYIEGRNFLKLLAYEFTAPAVLLLMGWVITWFR